MLVYFDGGCKPNPGKMSACVVICPAGKKPQAHVVDNLGNGTNNIAEWSALILAVTLLEDYTDPIHIMGDSLLVINQATGAWRIRSKLMFSLFREYAKAKANLNVTLTHVPRERNLAGRYLENGVI